MYNKNRAKNDCQLMRDYSYLIDLQGFIFAII